MGLVAEIVNQKGQKCKCEKEKKREGKKTCKLQGGNGLRLTLGAHFVTSSL